MIELMMTAVVVAIALLGFMGANAVMQQKSDLTFERTLALHEAGQVMEQIRSTADAATCSNFPSCVTTLFPSNQARPGFTNLSAFCGAQTNPPVNCDWPFVFTPDNTSREQVVVSYPANADPLDVTVTVVWAEGGIRRAAAALRSLLTKRS